MRYSSIFRPLAAAALLFSSIASAERMLFTNSLEPCPGSDDSGFTAELFDVTLTPDNNTVTYDITAVVSISGKVNATIEIIAYGYSIKSEKLDPCKEAKLSQLCPLSPGSFKLPSNFQLDPNTLKDVPGIAYTIPDVDAVVRARITNATDNTEVACVQAALSNGKTVDQPAVKWVTAIIAGIALCTSAVMSGLGHSNTAAHVAANALSLFGFFQSQAIFGMTSVRFPPIAQSWVQNFAWSMGIINISFMQTVLTWYQRATGGTPSTLLSNLQTYSVAVNKRSVDVVDGMMKRGLIPSSVSGEILKRGASFVRRSNDIATPTQSSVHGIERMGFREQIEPTNIFLTGLGIFVCFVVAVAIAVAIFKGLCELAAKRNWIKGDQFLDFRNGWKVILKGILFRIVLIGYAQMSILCLWELTVRDSAAEVVTAIFYFLAMTLALTWAAVKVWRLAKRSVHMHKNPAYILYSDPAALNKWGFLYVQYRASAYYWIFPQLVYILLKSMFVAFGQDSGNAEANGIAQAIGLLIIEIGWLISVCIVRPWMDKKTNTFNIIIAAVSFVSAVMLLIFSGVFNQPEIVTGVLGVVFAFYNMVFAAVLLVLVLLASGYAIFSKNPDTRYQPMRDDRGSFIKSQTNLNTELDALGQTARGNNMTMKRDLDEDTTSFAGSKEGYSGSASQIPNGSKSNLGVYSDHPAPASPGAGSFGYGSPRSFTPDNTYDRNASMTSGQGYGRPNGGSQWQRGAGYDH